MYVCAQAPKQRSAQANERVGGPKDGGAEIPDVSWIGGAGGLTVHDTVT